MLKRTITSIVAVIILLPVLWFSDTYIFPAALALITCIALYEMFSCIGFKTKFAVTLPAYLFGAAAPFLIKLFGNINSVIVALCAVMMVYILYLMMISVICHDKYSIKDISMCYITAIYIIGGFASIQLLRELSSSIYLLIFIGAWTTDIFAYFTGFFFGKHKLCEAVSPKKTIEGSIGGTLFCALAFVAFGLITLNKDAEIWKYAILAASGLIISVVSQIGDLSMSLIKRHYGIKDFGKLFPGHGGMLDRFDSIIAVSIVLFILVSTLSSLNINIFI